MLTIIICLSIGACLGFVLACILAGPRICELESTIQSLQHIIRNLGAGE